MLYKAIYTLSKKCYFFQTNTYYSLILYTRFICFIYALHYFSDHFAFSEKCYCESFAISTFEIFLSCSERHGRRDMWIAMAFSYVCNTNVFVESKVMSGKNIFFGSRLHLDFHIFVFYMWCDTKYWNTSNFSLFIYYLFICNSLML